MVGSRDLVRFGASESEDENVPSLVANPSRAASVLGWEPDDDLEARVRDAVEWWLARLGARDGRELIV
jgi:nucleoside-diphosphate-sugar epimerase